MFPLTEVLVGPVLDAPRARYVADPLPDFDPAEDERRFAGRYVCHDDLSLLQRLR